MSAHLCQVPKLLGIRRPLIHLSLSSMSAFQIISTASLSTSFQAPSLRRRMACWLYEGMLMFGVVFIAGYLFGTLSQTRNAMDNRHPLQAFLFIVFGIYFTWFWSRGQTLAMKTWHLRLVDVNGHAVTQSRAFLRYLLAWLWFLPPLAALAPFQAGTGTTVTVVMAWVLFWAFASRWQAQGQFLHDAIAGTRLIDWRPHHV